MNSSLLIDGSTLRKNFRIFRSLTSSKILQVVKANAYGHGLLDVTRILVSEGIDALGVVNVDEARLVRSVSSTVPIYVLGVVPDRFLLEAVSMNCIIPVWNPDQITKLEKLCAIHGLSAGLQIKIDTGMGRLGVLPSQLADLLRRLQNLKRCRVVAVYTHFSAADAEDPSSYQGQLATFTSCSRVVKEALDEDILMHASNSPAFLRDPTAHLDMVRLGIAGYGISPDPEIDLPEGVSPVARWISTLENIKEIPQGHGVSYGSEFVADRTIKVGVIPVGYADGFRRVPKGKNLVGMRGRLLPVLGRVCMDHIVVDLSLIGKPEVGEEVVLMGRDGDADLSAAALAVRWGTNEYDVVSNIGSRVGRVLLGGDG